MTKGMKISTVILATAVFLTVAISTRFEITTSQVAGIVRLDRWTGTVTQCKVRVVTTQCE
jgi:hypothetical protein